jgi:hypothetical protein
VVTAFLHGAQIDRLRVFMGYLKAERVDIESARPSKVGDPQLGMAEPDDVERRVQVWCRNGHVFSSSGAQALDLVLTEG